MVMDQEDFYFPKKEQDYYKSLYGVRQFWDSVIHYKKNNQVYVIVYRAIKKLYGEKYFFNAFFNACMLNSMLALFSIYLFFQILEKFHTDKAYKCIGILVFLEPTCFVKNGVCCANSFTVFALILFLYVMVFNKNMVYKYFSLFMLYLAHKIFYGCVPILFLYIFYASFHSSIIKKILFTVVLLFFILRFVNFNSIKYEVEYKLNRCYMSGNSYIPNDNNGMLTIFNAWYCPLVTNGTMFFYKAPEGSLLGWIYCIFINLIYILFTIVILLNIKKFRYMDKYRRHLVAVFLLFILSLSISFTIVLNYLNLNRHITNVLALWIVLIFVLIDKKSLNEENNNNFLELHE